jgi:hypothetical protein
VSNQLPPIDYGDLIEKWGGRRVEDTMIYIEGAKDHRGLLVSIPCTQKRVGAVLEAVYGEFE